MPLVNPKSKCIDFWLMARCDLTVRYRMTTPNPGEPYYHLRGVLPRGLVFHYHNAL